MANIHKKKLLNPVMCTEMQSKNHTLIPAHAYTEG